MGSRSRSGLGADDRQRYLRDNGFVMVRDGKGSHQVWENPDMKAACEKYKIELPENLRSTREGKNAWEQTLCNDPGPGTWQRLVKQVEWAQSQIAAVVQHQQNNSWKASLKQKFKAVADYNQWKKDVKHALKAGVKVPEPVVSYQFVAEVVQQKAATRTTFSTPPVRKF